MGWIYRYLAAWLLIMILSLAYMLFIAMAGPPSYIRSVIEEAAKQIIQLGKDIVGSSENAVLMIVRSTSIIFANNIRVLILSAIPFIGFAMYPLSLTVTSWVLRILAEWGYGENWRDVVVQIFLMPHTYIEVLAYSIAFVEGARLAYHIAVKKDISLRHIKRYLVYLVVAVVVLFVAAVVEAITIATVFV